MTMIPQYMVAHLRQKLAEDPRTNLLDVQVRVVGVRVFVAGTVESDMLRMAAEQVVREGVPDGYEVINELCIANYVH